MIDMNLIRTNPELVKENIRKKFQDHKLPLVDQAIELDAKRRALIAEGDALRAARNTLSKQVGAIVKVLPEPVTPSKTCSLSPFSRPSTNSAIA